MCAVKQGKTIMKAIIKDEEGFTLIEVAVASVITMVGLVFLAMMFTLSMRENRLTKQHTATTALAQQKLEELMARERNDAMLTVGGGLDSSSAQSGYYDQVYVDDSGTITTTIPSGKVANYSRYWKVENDPGGLTNAVLISVKVVATQTAARATQNSEAKNEQTTLTTVRSW
jgi:Tfp pilus assembly protein PilV